jgi:hypothetical protein
LGDQQTHIKQTHEVRNGRTAELRQVQQLSLVLAILKPIGCQLISSPSI